MFLSCRNFDFMGISLKNLFVLFVAGLFLYACGSEPTFPLSPEITFSDIVVKNADVKNLLGPSNGVKKDSVVISIGFKDGDGDLGATDAEVKQLSEKQKYNYVVNRFVKKNGQYILNNPIPTHSSVFGLIRPSTAKAGPVQGTLNFSIDFLSLNGNGKDSVYFDIQIIDRANNPSNVVRTKAIGVYKL